jgi:TetR/AcrR family transcriptional repressor of bet genes
MTEAAPKFRREPAQQRQEALILACLALVAEHGVRGATVREIAKRAEVTQGLIRYHFSSKEDLITAAYAYHMKQMTDQTAAPAKLAHASAKARLAVFVVAGLKPPVADPASVSLWASFLNKVRADAQMREIHKQTYHDFRGQLESLISDVLNEAGMPATSQKLRHLAIACNAVIDGLWMEAGALPDEFETGELPEIGLRSVGAIIGVKLESTKDLV